MSLKLLALETATEACSVALYVDGEIHQRFAIAPRQHAQLCLPWADALLAQAGITRSQLDAIAVSRGPGAFTGVRLGIALAQGIALALDRPVVPVSTLQVLALRAPAQATHVLACIDARMGEIYAARYSRSQTGALVLQDTEQLLAPDTLVLPKNTQTWAGVGSGFAAANALLERRLRAHLSWLDKQSLPCASDLLNLAVPAFIRNEGVAAEQVQAAYLRNNVALTLNEQQARRQK